MVLFLSLLANMMFDGIDPTGGDPNNVLQIGPVRLSPGIIGIASVPNTFLAS
jgi:hypothetical protein